MFEQRKFLEARDRLPEKMQKSLPERNVVVMLEPTDKASDQRQQKYAYEGIGYEIIHKDSDGAVFMSTTQENAKAYAEHAGRESSDSLKTPPKKAGVEGETDTIGTKQVSVESLLAGSDDED
jgi:hypothetical protein